MKDVLFLAWKCLNLALAALLFVVTVDCLDHREFDVAMLSAGLSLVLVWKACWLIPWIQSFFPLLLAIFFLPQVRYRDLPTSPGFRTTRVIELFRL
jgi:hypothetical protein